MRFKELKPRFSDKKSHIKFSCPKCLNKEGNGRLYLPVAKIDPEDKHWIMIGSTFEEITLSPSIVFTHGTKSGTDCNSHFYVTKGEILIV